MIVETVGRVRSHPFAAWKGGYTFVVDAPRLEVVKFSPLLFPRSLYGAGSETASCRRNARHDAPVDDCKCGFSGWYSRKTALEYMNEVADRLSAKTNAYPELAHRRPGLALQRVALFGNVVEGLVDHRRGERWGYRASRQQVFDVFTGDECCVCCGYAEWLGASTKREFFSMSGTYGRLLQPYCGAHLGRAYRLVQPTTLENRNKIVIHRGYSSN